MTGKTHVVWTCSHANPDVPNDRFDWLGAFLFDLRPDVAICLGDFDDMSSLNSYDTRYPKAVVNQSYGRDIEHGQDARERIWHKFRKNKRKMPLRIGLEGNHENRIKKAISHDPRLEGEKYGISFSHLNTSYHYDEYYEYRNSAPQIVTLDGVDYAHYFSGGNFGKPISGTHHAFSLIQNRHRSSVCGHSHKRSVYFKDGVNGRGIMAVVAGCYKGAEEHWAGQSQSDWWKGLVILRDVDNGFFDPEFVSMDRIKKEYGQ